MLHGTHEMCLSAQSDCLQYTIEKVLHSSCGSVHLCSTETLLSPGLQHSLSSIGLELKPTLVKSPRRSSSQTGRPNKFNLWLNLLTEHITLKKRIASLRKQTWNSFITFMFGFCQLLNATESLTKPCLQTPHPHEHAVHLTFHCQTV